jgi:hypothetical protein
MGLRDSPLCRKCGVEDETSVHILCRCEALASSRHTYLGSFFLEPRDIQHVSLGAIWRFGRAVGLPWENEWGTKGRIHIRPECIGAKRPRTPCQSIYLTWLILQSTARNYSNAQKIPCLYTTLGIHHHHSRNPNDTFSVSLIQFPSSQPLQNYLLGKVKFSTFLLRQIPSGASLCEWLIEYVLQLAVVLFQLQYVIYKVLENQCFLY